MRRQPPPGDCLLHPWRNTQSVRRRVDRHCPHTFTLSPKGASGAGAQSLTLTPRDWTLYVARQRQPVHVSDLWRKRWWSCAPLTSQGFHGGATKQCSDSDFRFDPTLFRLPSVANVVVRRRQTRMATYYVFSDAPFRGPVWSVQVAVGGKCLDCGGMASPSAFDGTNLYVAAGITTVVGQRPVPERPRRQLASGHFRWEHCFAMVSCFGAVSAVRGGAESAVKGVHWRGGFFRCRQHKLRSTSGQQRANYSPASIANGVGLLWQQQRHTVRPGTVGSSSDTKDGKARDHHCSCLSRLAIGCPVVNETTRAKAALVGVEAM